VLHGLGYNSVCWYITWHVLNISVEAAAEAEEPAVTYYTDEQLELLVS
jgi:hypothetical protein